jgi:uncharacterized protein (TIGR02302 family)
MTGDPQTRIRRKVAVARLAEGWERLWAAAFPFVLVTMTGLVIGLSGLAGWLLPSARYALAAGLLVAFALALKPFFALRLPDRKAALSRIERASGLKHRPLVALADELADPAAGPATRLLWQEHQKRVAATLGRLRVGLPRSRLPARDPYALRNALALLLIAVVALGGWDWRSRLSGTVARGVPAVNALTAIDAWITPPTYTRRAPILLSALHGEGASDITVPQGSVLVVRFNGASAPLLALAKPGEDGEAGEELSRPTIKSAGAEGVFETSAPLERPVTVTASDDGRTLGEWRIAIIPDHPPAARLTGDVAITPTGSFALPWEASDDYGVASLTARFALAGRDGEAFTSGSLEYDPPASAVALPRLNPRKANGRAFFDFTEHPWAGLEVAVTVEARDQAGQTTLSAPLAFKLPERKFRKPLARALIEQRRALVRAPVDAPRIAKSLSAIMLWPEGVLDKSGHYLSLRKVTTSLYRARTGDDYKAVVEGLWQVALLIEDGDLSSALKELEALRRELQQALAEGAPPERIAELMEQLREALDRYVEALNRQLQEALRNGELDNLQRVPEGQQIETRDLQRMLDMIENLARSGARDAAQELLSQLEDILRNLQPGIAGQMQPDRSPPLARMLDQLSQMMRRQQQLMDETFRLPDGTQNGMSVPPDAMEPGSRGSDQRRSEALADQQAALGRLLEELMRQLGQQGLQTPQGLNRAQRSMGDAADSLRGQNRDQALGEQGEALDGLRESAQAMAQQLMQQGTGNEGNYGRHGEARGDDRDPLGRPRPQRGEDFGPERDMLPSESAMERARQLLDALRERASDRTRRRLELDYLDRLLRGLY